MGLFYTLLGMKAIFIILAIMIASVITVVGIILLIIGIIKRKKYFKVGTTKKKYPNVMIAIGTVLICIPLIMSGIVVTKFVANRVTREKELTTAEKCEIIIEALQNKEKEPIKELFCEKAKNVFDLDTELNEFINFVDGNVISYDTPYATSGGFATDYEDGLIEKSMYGFINNIKTDSGRTYTLRIYLYNINKENSDLKGIVNLRIVDENVFTYENDYPDSGKFEIIVERL